MPQPTAVPGDAKAARKAQLEQMATLYAKNPVVVQRIQAEIDKLDAPAKTRNLIAGETQIQQEMGPDGQWHEVGRGPRFAKQVANNTTLPEADLEANAKAIAEYRRAPLTGFALRSPGAAAMMRRVEELNPSYDAKNYATAQRTNNSFAVGVEGRTVRSFNVAIDHLDTLKDAADALKNNDIKRRTF